MACCVRASKDLDWQSIEATILITILADLLTEQLARTTEDKLPFSNQSLSSLLSFSSPFPSLSHFRVCFFSSICPGCPAQGVGGRLFQGSTTQGGVSVTLCSPLPDIVLLQLVGIFQFSSPRVFPCKVQQGFCEDRRRDRAMRPWLPCLSLQSGRLMALCLSQPTNFGTQRLARVISCRAHMLELAISRYLKGPHLWSKVDMSQCR